MDDKADASSLFFHASRTSDASGEHPRRLAHLSASFRLHDAEIAFFNAVVGSLPAASDSFGHLKRAYDAQMRVPALVHRIARALDVGPDDTAAVDARLWNTLLALVQVRGHTWAERWDAVRVSLGLDPWASDDDEESYSMHELTHALQTPASPAHTAGPSAWTLFDAPSASHSPWSSPRSVSSDGAQDASDHRWMQRSASPMNLSEPRRAPLPTPASLAWTPRSVHGVSSRSQDSDVSDDELDAPYNWRTQRTLRTADAWGAARLLGRMLRRWYAALRAQHEAAVDAARAHDRCIVSQSLAAWRTATRQSQRRSTLAAAYADRALLRRAWGHWVRRWAALLDTRRAEHRAALRSAFYEVDTRRSHAIVAVAWTVRRRLTQLWRQASDRRLAVAVCAMRTKHAAFAIWRARSEDARTLSERGTAIRRRRVQRVLRDVWARWTQQTKRRHALAVATEQHHMWQQHNAWTKWRTHLARIRALDVRADAWAGAATHLHLREALRRWQLRARAAYAVRAADAQIVQTAWQTWWVRFTERTVAWQGTSLSHTDWQADAEARWARRRTEHTWAQWIQRTAYWERQAQYAARTHAMRMLWAAYTRWAARAHARREDALRADGAARLHTLRGAWRQWQAAHQAVRARRLRVALDVQVVGNAFQAWRLRAAQAQHWRTGAALLAAQTAARVQRTCLAHWLSRACARRGAFEDAAERADTQCVARALAHWRARCRTVRSHTDMADALRAAYDQGTCGAHAQEYATLAARRRWMLRRCFVHWLARTSVLPAVEHRRSTLQAHALRRWVDKLRARQREATARAFVRATVLRDALATWRAKCAYLAELRAVQGLHARARRTSDPHFRRRLAFVAPTARFS
ncbi:hypothetical protein CBS14141_001125 [Malassezia furfur]|nr:hypothetical protein CBS14141_001125 [Malassezia furfur]